jgi:alpha-galactosidase
VSDGKEVANFTFNFDHVSVTEAHGDIGTLGKSIQMSGRTPADEGIQLEKILRLEVYDRYPNLILSSVSYRNRGAAAIRLDQVILQRHCFNASLVDPRIPPYHFWSFQGSSTKWAKDDIVEITRDFEQSNPMGAVTNPGGQGGGVPLIALWTRRAGEAFGYMGSTSQVLSLPVKTQADGHVDAALALAPHTLLQPGEVYSAPRTFVCVYSGDFYEPLDLYSQVRQREEGSWPRPAEAAYNAIWVGWGYEYNFIPAQMLGVIPKLKELGIRWVQLADRWFEHYGDWDPRPDTFPGGSFKGMVDEYHNQGIKVQIYWHPLVAEDGQGHYHEHQYRDSDVLKQHPDWLILNKDGQRARVARGLPSFCPALLEVQVFHRQLTDKFIRQWGFDAQMLDYAYSVPPCYNPRHHHKSPEESVHAVNLVYRAIFDAGRAANPQCVTMCCPCGTTPNSAWLPYEDQAITADPVGSAQVRRRIKLYKALLGPQAAVSGDRVELTELQRQNGKEVDLGTDFASTVGLGGVPETMFVWPVPKVLHKTESITPEAVLLTPERELLWKKWIAIYNAKMLSRGTFRNLYVLGYDIPEGYTIEKDGRMYYAFFAPPCAAHWQGEIELRGLQSGRYRVLDYVDNKELGTIDGRNPRLNVDFFDHLLLEVSPL